MVWGRDVNLVGEWIFQTAVSLKPASLGRNAQNEKNSSRGALKFSFWALPPKPAGLEDTAV